MRAAALLAAALLAAALLATSLAARPAAAEERPALLPARDVAVTYRLTGDATRLLPVGAVDSLRASWDAAGERLRAEAAGRPAAVVHLRDPAAFLVDPVQRTVLRLPLREADVARALRAEGARFTREGRDTVAGLPCTVWHVVGRNADGTVCLTADNVPLRGEGTVNGRTGAFVAESVTYGRQPDALFRVPDGYVSLDLSHGLGGLLRAPR